MNKQTFIRFMNKNKIATAMIFGLVFAVIISSVGVFTSNFTTFANECNDIRHEMLRLHILANSDSKTDQQLKLKVRDKILQLDTQLLSEAKNLSESKKIVAQKLDIIKETAHDEIKRQGYNYDVKAELVNMYFSTREYDNFSLPAGNYDALRITIGSGKGKNWWCVLYPPLCLPAATQTAEIDDVLSTEQVEIIKNKSKYKIKFATVEFYEKIKKFFCNKTTE